MIFIIYFILIPMSITFFIRSIVIGIVKNNVDARVSIFFIIVGLIFYGMSLAIRINNIKDIPALNEAAMYLLIWGFIITFLQALHFLKLIEVDGKDKSEIVKILKF